MSVPVEPAQASDGEPREDGRRGAAERDGGARSERAVDESREPEEPERQGCGREGAGASRASRTPRRRPASATPTYGGDPEDFAPPEGESLKGLRLRLHRWLADLPTARSHVAVTHLGPIRALAAMALGLTFRRARRLRVDPATPASRAFRGRR